MHQRAEATLGADPGRGFVADAGYHSLDQLAYIEREQVDAVLADPTPNQRSKRGGETPQYCGVGEGRFTRSDFTYDPEADCYRCPAGEELTYQHTHKHRGRRRRIYGTSACQRCALKARCQPKAHLLRRIFRDEAEHLAEAMHERLKSEEARARLTARKGSVEPVIGNLKANLGFRRFRLRGLKQVKGELYLMTIAHNINTLFKMAQGGAFLALWPLLIPFFALLSPSRVRRATLSFAHSHQLTRG